MPSLELLERAAGSLGMAASPEGTSLRVRVPNGIARHFVEKNGKTVRKLGWLPMFGLAIRTGLWFWIPTVAFAGAAFLYPSFDHWLAVILSLLTLSFLGVIVTGAQETRTLERLYERADEMDKTP